MTDEPAPPRPARRVVVAEDEALIRLDVVEMLRDGGFDVVGEAGDGEQAVRLAEEQRPDLVVMDVKMPVLDGISAAERIVRARIAPVVLLTAFSQRELVERARDAGAMAYVVKPFSAADLLPALEIAVSRHQEIAALEAEVADLTDRFETRKLVDRAKGLLQQKFGMSEPDAFRWIQKTSMDKRLTMREVANAVVNSSASAAGSAAIRTGTPAAPGPSAGESESSGGPAPRTPTPAPPPSAAPAAPDEKR
jgi:AmiR/NasT family two-component response regulator